MESLKWSAPEYEHQHKTPDWFWVLGIFAVSGAIGAVLFGNLIFALLILIGSFVIAVFGARRPENAEFEITDRGILIGKRLFPFKTLSTFWIIENARTPRLYVISQKTLAPHIVIPLENISIDAVRERLSLKLPEEEEPEEPFVERVMDFLKF